MLKSLRADILIVQKGFLLAKVHYQKLWQHLFILTIFILLIAAFSAFIPFVLKLLVDSVTQNVANQSLFVDKTETTHIHYLLFLAIVYAVMWTLNQASDWIKGGFTSYFLSSIDASIYRLFLEKIMQATYSAQQSIDHGKFISQIQRAGNGIGQVVYILIWTMLPMMVQLVMAFIIIDNTINMKFSIFLLAFLLFALALALKLMQKSMDIHPMIYSAKNLMMSHGVERLKLLYEIKTNLAYHKEIAMLNKVSNTFVSKIFAANLQSAKLMALQIGFIGVLLMTSTVYLVLQTAKQQLSAGDFVMIIGYIIQLSLPMIMLSQLLIQLKGTIIAIADVFEYVDIAQDKPVNNNYHANFQHSVYHIKQLQLPHVHKLVNVLIQQGYWYAIIGKSGSGKSSFIQTLLALKDVDYLTFEFGGSDIQQLSYQNVLAYVVVVNQQSVVYKLPLADSLGYTHQADISYEMLHSVFKQLNLTHLLHYLETKSEEWVNQVSGGELQRLSICRAYLRQKPIIILDEPTSALDKQIADKVLQFLAENFSTVIMVTHNTNTLRFADYVMNMDDSAPSFTCHIAD